MIGPVLKLKQASAVLDVQPKELQNLVQFGVVKPQKSEGNYYFDSRTLLMAKFAFYLKDSLGVRTSVLSKLMDAFRPSLAELKARNPIYITFTFRLAPEQQSLKLGVPFRALEEELEERLGRVHLYRDLPPGRKRRGWKKEFLESLGEAAKDLGEVSEEEILRTIRSYRRQRRAPEITVAVES